MHHPHPRHPATIPSWALLTALGLTLSGCYYHVMGGPAVTTADSARVGGAVTASSGINGERGGVGLNVSAVAIDGQYSGMFGAEAFRLWRSPSQTGLQPFARAALGVLELGVQRRDELLVGGLSPRGELGLMWLGRHLGGLTLSVAAEYRPRIEGPSTPMFWLQLGFGSFDYMESRAERLP